MRIVLDTNVLLAALPHTSETHLIFLRLVQGAYTICLTTDILAEYEEIFGQRANPEVATRALDIIDILPNIARIHKHYFWHLITADPDDNKFVDCAIAATADFIVTDDRHFRILKDIPFPKVNILSSKGFLEMLQAV